MKDYFLFAISSLRHRKLRSWLTVLGIVIGIAAIVALISVSQGLENAIVEQFENIGSNRLFIAPGGAEIQTGSYIQEGLTTDDLDVVKSVPGVDWAYSYVSSPAEVEFGNEKAFSEFIFGIDPKIMKTVWGDFDVELEDGAFFEGNEKYDAVLGNDVAHKFFDREVRVGNLIEIKGVKFKVKGIVEKLGSPDDDQTIMIPEDIVRQIFNKPDEVNIIDVKAKEGVDINVLASRVERVLKRSRDDDDFQIMTPDQLLRQISEILLVVQVILGGIAAISLLVGGVGIMNSMYTNVLERTREIGIMKSVGATNKNIMMIFLIEAGIMGFVGGVLGVAFGSIIALAVGEIAKQEGFQLLKIIIDWKLAAFGILFAFAAGALSGYLPAKQASKMNPVESLRYGQ